MENKAKTSLKHTKKTVIVSACLLGLPTRYDGGDCRSPELIQQLSGFITIALCPEELGGLTTPRRGAEISEGDGRDVLKDTACVVTTNEADAGLEQTNVTANFIKGAEEVLRIARLNSVNLAYLKEKSPSCGVNLIKKNREDQKGMGVTAALLKENGIETIGIP